ncbi:MAG: tetratricopeptide repeat protein [Actinomycetota bacterium]|nr:tetratricopeptide repeat protein [Actinomycetota bacterium]
MTNRNLEQIELVTEELADLTRQVEIGDLDEVTAERLRERYIAELDGLMAERTGEASPDSRTHPSPGTGGEYRRISRRAVAGTAIVAIAITIIGVYAVNSLTGPSAAGAEGVAGDVLIGERLIDLDTVSNEEMEDVVAANPDVIGMRLALARRYFEATDFDLALDHYMEVLEREKHPEALANVGWMTYLSGRPDIALGYVEASLQRQPGSLAATWFLGNIQFALGNYDDAAVALLVIVTSEGVPEDVKASAELLLVEMEGR